MIDSPFVLAGIIVGIVGVVAGIVATIVHTRGERGFSFPSPVPAYEPPDVNDAPSADLSRLDALSGSSAPRTAERLDSGVVSEPVAYEPADQPAAVEPEPEPEPVPEHVEPAPSEIVDEPERDFEPLPGLWHHLIETDDGPLGVQDRLDMVARLEMVGEKWCVDALHSASTEEQDLQVNAAVRAVLARLGD